MCDLNSADIATLVRLFSELVFLSVLTALLVYSIARGVINWALGLHPDTDDVLDAVNDMHLGLARDIQTLINRCEGEGEARGAAGGTGVGRAIPDGNHGDNLGEVQQ